MKKQLVSALAVFALGVGISAPAMAAPEAPPLPPSTSVDQVEKKVPVIVTLERQPKGGAASDARLVSDAVAKLGKKYGFEARREFSYLVNGFSAYVPEDALGDLAAEQGVLAVDRMRVYYPSMESATELTQVDAAAESYGVDGRGLVVAIVDTGIDISHQDMRLDEDVEPRLAPEAGFTAKVPYGYNFADENSEVKDLAGSQHGMHVAGIVAANGGDDAHVVENGRVNGVAPNAQLLAMKVFSNDPSKPGAAADDIMAAVEESVKRGADVINLSLGYPNGNEGHSVGEQRVLANARAAGVEVIVAAGNEGQNGSATGEADDALGYLDDGTVGSPSTGTGAWSVASVENSKLVRTLATAKQDEGEHKFGYDIQTGEADGQPHEIVDAGYGTFTDTFGKDFSGKFVLIQRGAAPGEEPLSFKDKFRNAQISGAEGVILYNHEAGGDDIPGMGGIDEFTFPGVAIGHSDGVKLQEMIAAGTTTVTLTDEHLIEDNPNAGLPSSFTSWGAGPELGFKPEIAGIGGEVYSTVNGDGYATMSGTSMAAPHVAGVSALMIEKGQQSFPQLSRSQIIERGRVALSNTAQILTRDEVPFAPRQVGAGLVQVKDALETEVLATVDGEPVVALKEVAGSESFTVTLKNESDEQRSFTAGGTCVVNENNSVDEAATTFCSKTDSIAASATDVTIPAGGSVDVTYTLSVAGEPHWTQGWVTFESKDEGEPDLSVPYLGFAGDWNAERIVDYPAYKGFPDPVLSAVGSPTRTSLYTEINGGEYTFGDGEQFISPNGDGLADAVYAKLAMLRNAKRLEVSVLDEAGNVLRDVTSVDDVVRATLQAQSSSQTNTFQVNLSSYAFDGSVYDPQKAAFEVLPDGKYIYRVSASVGSDWEPQTLDMPFGIDTVAPTIEVLSNEQDDDGNYVVRVKATDERSGVNAVQGRFTWPGYVAKDEQPEGDVHTIVIPKAIAEVVGYFELYASDFATNVVRKTVMLGEKLIVESDPTLKDLTHIGIDTESEQTEDFLVGDDGTLVLTGRADASIVQVRVGEEVVDVPDSGRFEIHAEIEQGENTVTLEGLDAAGNVVASKSYSFIYDYEPPVVAITSPVDADEIASQVAEGVLHVEGTVSDNIDEIATVTVGGQAVTVTDGKFSADVSVDSETSMVEVHAYDQAGNLGVGVIVLKEPSVEGGLTLEANLSFSEGPNVVSGENEALQLNEDGSFTFLYSGRFNYVPGLFKVNGDAVEVAQDGSFSVPLPLKEGISDFNVTIVDVDGAQLANTQMKVFLDLHAPQLELLKPSIDPDGALYLRAPGDVEFAGSVSDNAFGYELLINGDSVERFLTLDDPGAQVSRRDFSKTVKAADGDKIFVLLRDHVENGFLWLIPVVVDDVAPVVSVDALRAGEKLVAGEAREVSVRVEDLNLASASVYLDGELVDSARTVLRPAAGAEAELIQGIDQLSARGAEGESDESSDSVEPATREVSVLSFSLPGGFELGEHELLVTGVDKAGNQASVLVPFSVVEPVVEPSEPGEGTEKPFVPGIDEGDLSDPDANPGGNAGAGDGSGWVPGKVDSDDVRPGFEKGSTGRGSDALSSTGVSVAGWSTLAGALLLVGVLLRRRAAAKRE